MRVRFGTFDLGYRLVLSVEVCGKRRAWRSPKLPLPLSLASLKYLWRHHYDN